MKCFYHSADLDGYCSGAIVKKEFPDCEMIGINYGDEFPWHTIEDEVVFMVDFSLPTFEEMIELDKNCNYLVWVDHHKTAIEKELEYVEKLKGMPDEILIPIEGLRRIGIGACALVWELLYPDRPIPYGVKLLAEYDVWNHSNPDALPFQYGMRIQDTRPESPIWNNILSDDGSAIIGGVKKTSTHFIRDMCMDGKAILKYQEQYEERYAKRNYFFTILRYRDSDFQYYYKCIAINKALTNSLLFNSVKSDDVDIMIAFCWNGSKQKWLVSLYTEKEDVDVSAVAKHFGGGGHKGAAGFSCNTLPFPLL